MRKVQNGGCCLRDNGALPVSKKYNLAFITKTHKKISHFQLNTHPQLMGLFQRCFSDRFSKALAVLSCHDCSSVPAKHPDVAAMGKLWVEDGVCAHPGFPAIYGREEITEYPPGSGLATGECITFDDIMSFSQAESGLDDYAFSQFDFGDCIEDEDLDGL